MQSKGVGSGAVLPTANPSFAARRRQDRRRHRLLTAYFFSRHYSPADGAEDQLGNAVQVQLFHDAPAMGFHGVQTEAEAVGDFLVAVALGEELVDLALAIGEQVVTVAGFA